MCADALRCAALRVCAEWTAIYAPRNALEKTMKLQQDVIMAAKNGLEAAIERASSATAAPRPALTKTHAPHAHALKPTPALSTACSTCGLVNISGSLMVCTAGCS